MVVTVNTVLYICHGLSRHVRSNQCASSASQVEAACFLHMLCCCAGRRRAEQKTPPKAEALMIRHCIKQNVLI